MDLRSLAILVPVGSVKTSKTSAADEERALLGGEEGGDFGVGEVGGDFHGDVAGHAGEAWEFFELRGAGAALAQGAEEEFGDIDGMTGVDVAGA
jgi:hypothetical protein